MKVKMIQAQMQAPSSASTSENSIKINRMAVKKKVKIQILLSKIKKRAGKFIQFLKTQV